jgi:hypothetical protein
VELFLAVTFLIVFALYFLPSIVAGKRRHPNQWAIFWLNLLLGWTGIVARRNALEHQRDRLAFWRSASIVTSNARMRRHLKTPGCFTPPALPPMVVSANEVVRDGKATVDGHAGAATSRHSGERRRSRPRSRARAAPRTTA